MSRSKRKSNMQASIESFVSPNKRVKEDVHFKVPFLPLTAPEEPTPAAFRSEMPLYAHQRRSLHRMLQIEARDESVAKFNFGMLDYFSKGGALADAIGMGKTATMLALIAGEPRDYAAGANLLVAPSHLLAQWKREVDKFVTAGEIDVVVGFKQYMELVENPAAKANISNRMLVLVGVEEVVKSRSHYYRYGKLYPLETYGRGKPLHVEPFALEEYEEAAKFIHKAYCGPLWVSPLHLPGKPWRRAVFEEVQDLVLPGKSARDCFIQLTHRCLNVWLITATPFPGKAESIYANNQLLGFKRLRLMPHDPAFDEIKRKLYLRNCAQVKQQAITDKIKVEETYIPVKLHPKELLLYRIERVLAVKQAEYDVFALGDVDVLSAGGKEGTAGTVSAEAPVTGKDAVANKSWSEQYKSARQSCVHAGISDRLLERAKKEASKDGVAPTLAKIKSPSEVFRDENYNLKMQHVVATRRKNEVEVMEKATRNTVAICNAIHSNTYASVRDCFDDMENSGLSGFFNDSGETEAGFRMLYKHYPYSDELPEPTELLLYYKGEIEDYVRKYFNKMNQVEKLKKQMESTLNERCPRARAVVEEQLKQVTECMALFNSIQDREYDAAIQTMPAYGSKIAALVQYLNRLPKIKVVIFTMWDQALRVVNKALRLANITSAVFLQHQSSETKSAHVASFHSGDTQVLILNSLTSASGINLQVASHVIFLDPVGFSPTQASTLEQQAIGRVLRMGQTNASVTVVRFIAEDTMEASLYDDIHEATTKAVAADDTFFDGEREDAYVCTDFAAPVRRVVRMFASADDGGQVEDEEIEIEAAMSIEEAITHRIEQAEAEGEVFDLTEDAPVDLEQQLAAAREHDATHQRKKRRTRGNAGNSVSAAQFTFNGDVLVKNEPQVSR
ncbi:DNA repair protein RAD5 [Phytophthora citrophthora]|uniref:DNA repair protein RAD5 n=1 Tax=Phytophthora citrophthora TaxID=4793 RepID=A0AAD9G9R1_9STRA|nr:DNA repair protein RAD5 [Phytophthora citrophthora]